MSNAPRDPSEPEEIRIEQPRRAPQTGAAERIGSERIAAYHEYTRTKGVNTFLYIFARLILQPALLIWLRLDRIGKEYAKLDDAGERGLIVAANHRSFLDPFVLGFLLPWNRPLHYVAKSELFEKRWQGWIISRLGAYPVRRGQADGETVATSAAILERGGAVCIFPEGTRIRRGSLATPHRGVGRLAGRVDGTESTLQQPTVVASERQRWWREAQVLSRRSHGQSGSTQRSRTVSMTRSS